MNTLNTTPIAPLLDRLFKDADKSSPERSLVFAELSGEERARLIGSKTDSLDCSRSRPGIAAIDL